MSNRLIHESAINHFIKHQPSIGVFGDRLHGGHLRPIMERTQEPMYNLIDHLRDRVHKGGSYGSGGDLNIHISRHHNSGGGVSSGGSIHTGGTLEEPPEDEKKLYHYALQLTPHQFELLREVANQLLGAKPSPVWDDYSGEGGDLETDGEEYEKIIDMPNTHAAARMIEAGIGHGKGGGFAKAFKHAAKIGSRVYKAGRGVLQWATKNKDLLVGLLPEEYQSIGDSFLETANSIDAAVNPIVDATIEATKETATDEDRRRLKKLAEQSIDKAIETHLPGANEYYKGAKEAYGVYQSGDKEKIRDYAMKKGEQALDRYAPEQKKYYDAAKDLYQTQREIHKKPITAN